VSGEFAELLGGEEILGGVISRDFIQEVKTTFYYASFVSPLLLLIPKKYGRGHAPQHIIAVSTQGIRNRVHSD